MRRRRGNVSGGSRAGKSDRLRWLDPRDLNPRPELFGLSPAQACLVAPIDWSAPSPFSLDPDVPVEKLARAPAMYDLYLILRAVSDRGVVPAVTPPWERERVAGSVWEYVLVKLIGLTFFPLFASFGLVEERDREDASGGDVALAALIEGGGGNPLGIPDMPDHSEYARAPLYHRIVRWRFEPAPALWPVVS